MSLCLGSQVWPGVVVLASTHGREQPQPSPEARRAQTKVYPRRQRLEASFRWASRLEVSQNLRGAGLAPLATTPQIR